jgi:hypothetical protein
MVKNVSVGPGWQQEWPTPIRVREWLAADGTEWRMRGGPIDERAVRNLLRRPGVKLLHVYGMEPRELDLAEGSELVASLNTFYAGKAQPHADFTVADFRDDEHNVLLVVQESC